MTSSRARVSARRSSSNILDIARAEKLGRVMAKISPDNEGMQRICKSLGFRLTQAADSLLVDAVFDL